MDVSLLEVVVSSVAVGSRCGTSPLHAGCDQKCGGSGRGQRDMKQRDPITKYCTFRTVLSVWQRFREAPTSFTQMVRHSRPTHGCAPS